MALLGAWIEDAIRTESTDQRGCVDEQSQRNRSVLDFNRRVLLTNAIFGDQTRQPTPEPRSRFANCTASVPTAPDAPWNLAVVLRH
jgi:hypothetical protein